MTHRLLLAIGLATSLAASLAACASPTPTAAAPTPTAPTAQPTAAPTEPALSQKIVEGIYHVARDQAMELPNDRPVTWTPAANQTIGDKTATAVAFMVEGCDGSFGGQVSYHVTGSPATHRLARCQINPPLVVHAGHGWGEFWQWDTWLGLAGLGAVTIEAAFTPAGVVTVIPVYGAPPIVAADPTWYSSHETATQAAGPGKERAIAPVGSVSTLVLRDIVLPDGSKPRFFAPRLVDISEYGGAKNAELWVAVGNGPPQLWVTLLAADRGMTVDEPWLLMAASGTPVTVTVRGNNSKVGFTWGLDYWR